MESEKIKEEIKEILEQIEDEELLHNIYQLFLRLT
jgi:metal-sulfur cluster biosynthetic enzyme